ncbi:MAG: hypothetical protein KC609_12010 [Myxococcales bacterium]|nr:hypothetical protein [Myxococcales bacterium]
MNLRRIVLGVTIALACLLAVACANGAREADGSVSDRIDVDGDTTGGLDMSTASDQLGDAETDGVSDATTPETSSPDGIEADGTGDASDSESLEDGGPNDADDTRLEEDGISDDGTASGDADTLGPSDADSVPQDLENSDSAPVDTTSDSDTSDTAPNDQAVDDDAPPDGTEDLTTADASSDDADSESGDGTTSDSDDDGTASDTDDDGTASDTDDDGTAADTDDGGTAPDTDDDGTSVDTGDDAGSCSVPVSPGHTLSLDGSNDLGKFSAGELHTPGAQLENWTLYGITWDATHLYLALATTAFETGSKVLHVYLEVNANLAIAPVESLGKLYGGYTAYLPFTATHVIGARSTDDFGPGPYNGVWSWSTGDNDWVMTFHAVSGTDLFLSSDKHTIAVRIPWAELGCPSTLRLSAHVINAITDNEWKETLPQTHTPWTESGVGYYDIDFGQGSMTSH